MAGTRPWSPCPLGRSARRNRDGRALRRSLLMGESPMGGSRSGPDRAEAARIAPRRRQPSQTTHSQALVLLLEKVGLAGDDPGGPNEPGSAVGSLCGSLRFLPCARTPRATPQRRDAASTNWFAIRPSHPHAKPLTVSGRIHPPEGRGLIVTPSPNEYLAIRRATPRPGPDAFDSRSRATRKTTTWPPALLASPLPRTCVFVARECAIRSRSGSAA
jgi:hypothetical protein